MIVSFRSGFFFRGGWKYPVGYVLCNKISAYDLHCLVKRALDFCVEANLKVLGITMDGTNFSAMRTFGCRPSLDQFVPSFHYEGFDDPIYFTPDPPHMVQARPGSSLPEMHLQSFPF